MLLSVFAKSGHCPSGTELLLRSKGLARAFLKVPWCTWYSEWKLVEALLAIQGGECSEEGTLLPNLLVVLSLVNLLAVVYWLVCCWPLAGDVLLRGHTRWAACGRHRLHPFEDSDHSCTPWCWLIHFWDDRLLALAGLVMVTMGMWRFWMYWVLNQVWVWFHIPQPKFPQFLEDWCKFHLCVGPGFRGSVHSGGKV